MNSPSLQHDTHDKSGVEQTPRASRFTRIATLIVALLGAAAFGLLLWHIGGTEVLVGLRALGRAWPLLLVLELGRIACELVGTRALLGHAAQRMPFGRLLRGQLIGQALDVVMPAGRAAAEAAKAAVYARDLGLPQTAAVATALQLAVLFANALWALAGFAVSGPLGLPSALRIGLLAYAGAMTALVLAVAICAGAPRVRALLTRVPFLHDMVERFADLIVSAPRRLVIAVMAQLAGRAVQAVQLAAAAVVLGAKPSLAQLALTQSVYLVGAAIGDLVPAQLGTTDAAFVLAAPALGLTVAAAFSVTLAVHAVQVVMAGISGLGALGLWWSESRDGHRRSEVDSRVSQSSA